MGAGAKVEERSDETPPCGAKLVTNLLILLSVLALVILFNYLTIRVLSTVPHGMNNYLILCELIVEYEISND
jgi:hypothetical protein